MGAPSAVIHRVETPKYGWVLIDASDGFRYEADLAALSAVYCYPPTPEAWSQVGIDGYGLGLIWASRFEVHIDQIMGQAVRRYGARRFQQQLRASGISHRPSERSDTPATPLPPLPADRQGEDSKGEADRKESRYRPIIAN